MLPVNRDPVNGAHMIEFLATIYAWSGEPALACDQLEVATKIPGNLSYGQLKLSRCGTIPEATHLSRRSPARLHPMPTTKNT